MTALRGMAAAAASLGLAAGAAAVLGLAAATAGAAAPPGPGADIYAALCARCHGADGRPELPGTPDFTRGQGLRRSDRELARIIRFGQGTMPGFDTEIDNQGLIDVLFHLRALER